MISGVRGFAGAVAICGLSLGFVAIGILGDEAEATLPGLKSNCEPDDLFADEVPRCGLVIDLPSDEVLVVKPLSNGQIEARLENCCLGHDVAAHIERSGRTDTIHVPEWGVVKLEYRQGWPPLATAIMAGGQIRKSYANEGPDEIQILRQVCRKYEDLRKARRLNYAVGAKFE